MTVEKLNKVYDILVQHGGADEPRKLSDSIMLYLYKNNDIKFMEKYENKFKEKYVI